MTVELGPVVSGYGPSPSPSRTSSQSGPSTPQSPASPFVASRSSSRRSATNSRDTASIDMSERIFEFDCLRLVNAKPGHGLRQRSRSGSSSRTDRSTLSMSPMSPAAGQTSFDHDRSGTWGRSSGSQGNRSRSATSVSADVGLDALGLSSVHTSEKSSKPKKGELHRASQRSVADWRSSRKRNFSAPRRLGRHRSTGQQARAAKKGQQRKQRGR